MRVNFSTHLLCALSNLKAFFNLQYIPFKFNQDLFWNSIFFWGRQAKHMQFECIDRLTRYELQWLVQTDGIEIIHFIQYLIYE